MREYRAVQSVEGGIGTTLLVPYSTAAPGYAALTPGRRRLLVGGASGRRVAWVASF
jgi:hypothetical protein